MTRRGMSDGERYAAARWRQGAAARAARDRARWAAGQVVPDRITTALNLAGLYGPEVDVACGAREPDVDRWEAGELYPTWEQLGLLAELTGVTVGFFFRAPEPWIAASDTSLRFHLRRLPPERPRVLAFTPGALWMAGLAPAADAADLSGPQIGLW